MRAHESVNAILMLRKLPTSVIIEPNHGKTPTSVTIEPNLGNPPTEIRNRKTKPREISDHGP